MQPKVALATTGIGSLPRPAWLGARTRGSIKFSLEGAALAEALDYATILALRDARPDRAARPDDHGR